MEDRGRPTRWAGARARFKEVGGAKLDTIITGHLTQEQVAAYQQVFRIEEISDVLRRGYKSGSSLEKALPSYKARNFRREPSPPPQYDQNGNRTNTREARLAEQLEKERHALVEIAVTAIKNYDPPGDYLKPAKTTEKLYIPIKDYPDINFVGLLLGPRGNTLRQLQDELGAKLAIRGKGSVKDGKNDPNSGEDDLHVLVTADTSAKIRKAIKLTNEVIEKAILSPVGQNDMKRDQLRELAVLNGTLRETKPYVPPDMFGQQRRMPTRDLALIVCRICGNVGHYSRDCKMRDDRLVDSYSPRRADGADAPWKRQKLDLQAPPWAQDLAPHYGLPPPPFVAMPSVPPHPSNPPAFPPTFAPPPPVLAAPPPPPGAVPPPPSSIAPPPPSIAPPAAPSAPPSAPPSAAPSAPSHVPPPPSNAAPPPPPSSSAPPPPPSNASPPPPPPSAAQPAVQPPPPPLARKPSA